MIEEQLNNLKKEYLKTEMPHYLQNYGWQNLESRLAEVKSPQFSFFPKRAFAFAVLSVIILLISTLAISQKSKPGQTLYPVKVLSDQVYSQVTGNYEATIEKRAQEVIDTSGNGESFEEASKEYQKTLDEAKEKAKDENEEKKEELRKKLEQQEKRFENAQKEENQKSKNRLNDILERTRRTRGEVKGSKNERREKDNQRHDDDEKDNNSGNHNEDD